MTMPAFLDDERIADLLVLQATEGLSAGDAVELRALLARHDHRDREIFDRTAAAVLLAGAIEPEPLPAALRRKLDVAADAFVVAELGHPANEAQLGAAVTTAGSSHGTKPRAGSMAGWLAAAACLLLALMAWWPRWQTTDDTLRTAQVPAPRNPTAAEARTQLLARADVVRQSWQTTEDPAARSVSGDVVWDNEGQTGYMRFRGLPANDSTQMQYQLWIFDAARGDQFPVDGGVFDVPVGADEVVVPIDPKLPVTDPRLFAVTVEKSGGVVVSARARIVVLAELARG